LEYARGAVKNRGKIGGGGTLSFIIGQPGILVEMTGGTQPISMKRVTHVMSVTSYLSCGRGVYCHVAINEGVAPSSSCLCPGFFVRASTKGNDFTWRRNNNNNNNNNNNRLHDPADL